MSLLRELRDAGAKVTLDGGEIVLRGVPRRLAERARESKAELMAELRAEEDSPAFAVPHDERLWARTMRRMIMGLLPEILPLVLETGDPADEVRRQLESWLAALRHHDRHGANWWRKHGEELKGRMRSLFPDRFAPEEELAGAALEHALYEAFPTAARGDRFAALFPR